MTSDITARELWCIISKMMMIYIPLVNYCVANTPGWLTQTSKIAIDIKWKEERKTPPREQRMMQKPDSCAAPSGDTQIAESSYSYFSFLFCKSWAAPLEPRWADCSITIPGSWNKNRQGLFLLVAFLLLWTCRILFRWLLDRLEVSCCRRDVMLLS